MVPAMPLMMIRSCCVPLTVMPRTMSGEAWTTALIDHEPSSPKCPPETFARFKNRSLEYHPSRRLLAKPVSTEVARGTAPPMFPPPEIPPIEDARTPSRPHHASIKTNAPKRILVKRKDCHPAARDRRPEMQTCIRARCADQRRSGRKIESAVDACAVGSGERRGARRASRGRAAAENKRLRAIVGETHMTQPYFFGGRAGCDHYVGRRAKIESLLIGTGDFAVPREPVKFEGIDGHGRRRAVRLGYVRGVGWSIGRRGRSAERICDGMPGRIGADRLHFRAVESRRINGRYRGRGA